jgi:hypothetical protein
MTVISISIITSTDEVVAGVPRTISISTNISASIFYTLDGTDPTILSNIYISPLVIPNSTLSVTLKVFATNGVISSPIIEEIYQTDMIEDARLSHSTTTQPIGAQTPPLYPFGTSPSQPTGEYVNASGITVDDPNLPTLSNGFNADGYPSNFTNSPYDTENYSIVYSTTNAQGETGPGIGTLPAKVTIENIPAPPEESQQFTNMFNPRALVIFQDFSK